MTENNTVNNSQTGVNEVNPEALFEDTSSITEIEKEVSENPEEVVLLTDPDDSDKLSILSGTDFEDSSEEDMYSLMDTDEEIRDSLTVNSGSYIIEIFPVDVKGKGVKYTNKVVNGKVVPHKPKSIGFSCHVVYDIKNKEMVDDYVYQSHHLLKKDGSLFERGKTGYKQFCYYATAAVLDMPYETLVEEVDKRIVPLRLFNEKAATSDDSPKYMQVTIVEHPPKNGYPAQNEVMHSTMRSDYGLYMKLLESK